MKKIRTAIIATVFVAVMVTVFVGCSPVEQQKEEPKVTYYDYGTRTYHLSTENEGERGYISFWLPDMLEGRENNDKYVEFWGENVHDGSVYRHYQCRRFGTYAYDEYGKCYI